MAESQSMTSAEVVAKALMEEHPDFLREKGLPTPPWLTRPRSPVSVPFA